MKKATGILAVLVVAIALAATGCAREESVVDVSNEVQRLESAVVAVEARLEWIQDDLAALEEIEARLSALEAREPSAPDLTTIEDRFDELEALLLSVSDTGATVIEETVTYYEGSIPMWLPGTTAEEGAVIFEECIVGRVSAAMGPLGGALGPSLTDFADIDLAEFADELGIPDGLPGVDEALPVWLLGTLFGCWTGDLN